MSLDKGLKIVRDGSGFEKSQLPEDVGSIFTETAFLISEVVYGEDPVISEEQAKGVVETIVSFSKHIHMTVAGTVSSLHSCFDFISKGAEFRIAVLGVLGGMAASEESVGEISIESQPSADGGVVLDMSADVVSETPVAKVISSYSSGMPVAARVGRGQRRAFVPPATIPRVSRKERRR